MASHLANIPPGRAAAQKQVSNGDFPAGRRSYETRQLYSSNLTHSCMWLWYNSCGGTPFFSFLVENMGIKLKKENLLGQEYFKWTAVQVSYLCVCQGMSLVGCQSPLAQIPARASHTSDCNQKPTTTQRRLPNFLWQTSQPTHWKSLPN